MVAVGIKAKMVFFLLVAAPATDVKVTALPVTTGLRILVEAMGVPVVTLMLHPKPEVQAVVGVVVVLAVQAAQAAPVMPVVLVAQGRPDLLHVSL